MSLTRRSAIALTGSGLTAALAGVAIASTQPTNAHSLIEAHRAAVAFSDAKWNDLGDVTEANPAVDLMCPKVQYGRLLLAGRNDDGTDNWKPLFAYDEATIDKEINRDRDARMSFWGFGPKGEDRKAEIHANAEARRERLKAELRRQTAEANAAEDACGITAAREIATAASRAATERKDALLAHPCRDMGEVAAVAAYLVECEAEDIIEVEEDFVAWIRSLAGKAVAL